MAPRQNLQNLLINILGNTNVYFQPPSNITMKYPCIVYRRNRLVNTHADNAPYTYRKQYSITLMEQDPDSTVYEGILALPTCSFDRFYVADNLNHNVFSLYF